MKKAVRPFALLFIVVLCALMLLGCKNTADIDTSKLTPKPDINKALLDYQNCRVKKSVFEAGLKLTMFMPSKKEKVIPISFGQLLRATRIQNQEVIYIDATLNSEFVSDNFITVMDGLISLAKISDSNIGEISGDVKDYIQGETLFAGRLAYNGEGAYNAKGDYVRKGETPDFLDHAQNPIWVATSEQSILNFQKNMGFSGQISVKDYLMFSTIIDLSPQGGWVKKDEGDKYFNKEKDAYLYQITTYGAKLKAFILDVIGQNAENFDEERYAEDLYLYTQIIPIISSWLSTPDSSVGAEVTKGGQLKKLSSSIRVDININVNEMWDILELLAPDYIKSNMIWLKALLNNRFVSAAGDYGIWTLRIDFTIDEYFYYDDASVDLSKLDQDMFIDHNQEVEGRTVFLIDAIAH
ncbi:MAG: hypothetical protein ACOYEC_03950 [Christensenellales bacterium]|jgi:hypothetical protein|nr:hypothetical protein [Clostridiales bacterium]